MNCQNGSCSLRRNNSSSGLFGQAQPFMNLNGAAFQKFGNGSFNRLQGFNPQMFSNMRFQQEINVFVFINIISSFYYTFKLYIN